MKLTPKVGDALTVRQGKETFAATVIEVKRDGAIVCRVQKVWPVVLTFDADGHGLHGARLRPVRRVKGVKVKGAIE